MKVRRRFLWALAISLAVHLGVLSGPGWRLPLDELLHEDEPILDAHLVGQPRTSSSAPARPKPNAKPKQRRAPAPAPVDDRKVSAGDTPPVADIPVPVEQAAVAAEPEPAVAVVVPAEIALPRQLRIHYEVTMGENGFVIGEAIQELRHDGATYALSSTAATTGLAGLFRPAKVVNVSEGDVVAGGLRPREFRIERSRGESESARFDWQAGKVTLSGDRQFELEAGAQDMLSMFCQLALMVPTDAAVVSVPVVTGKKVERYAFAVVGEEKIATPRGERTTLHLRTRQASSKESTDVWLGLEDSRLPVKIRHVDRRGDMFEQIADKIEFDVGTEGPH
ncbi:MAG TPA: DUF3108 domain-containing protein [Rhodocyclaceae bacterium]|nr:DUF3108 domain-containing protein [Rhodocyclaceae bacterium]